MSGCQSCAFVSRGLGALEVDACFRPASRARQLREHSSFADAGVYDPPSVGGTHVIYVLHDATKPELYGGLPSNPQIPLTYTVWKRFAKPIRRCLMSCRIGPLTIGGA